MTLTDINKNLSQLAEHRTRESILELSFTILQWLGIVPNAGNKPQLLSPQTQKLKDYLVTAPQTVQPQLYRLSADGQNIRVRFAVLKKLKKDYISQLVDNDPGLSSYQSFVKGLAQQANGTGFIPTQPYFIHFVTTPDYNKLVLIFNHGDQKRIVSFRNRLTNTQYNKIIQQWQGIGTKSKPEIADLLWKSLDIKEVNKEFYKQIKERFDALLGIVKTQHSSATENQVKQFTVRLIGRYIFCWFLKEKEIIGQDLIGKKTIEETENFYQNTLLKLFFETLNTKVQDRNPLTHEKLFEKIPYLNGGLFDESEEDKLFRNLNLDAWLLPFVEILESYDFTVDESSRQYQHVAVDPEMLGRIFENLLASQNEETEKLANQRKAFGAFYTPREIVDYMVNESIRAYLQTQWEQHIVAEKTKHINNPEPLADLFGNRESQQLSIETKHYELKEEEKNKIEKALEPLFTANPDAGHLKKEDKTLLLTFLELIKILDPACGSGAFPMGILHKLVELHEILGTVKSGYELKKDILSQNIYGVDIMPMAIEIARLRAWLSLVLEEDYKPNDPKHNFGVKPLPNLDFKFVCANSLIDLGLDAYLHEEQGKLGLYDNLIQQLKELENLRKQFFLPVTTHTEKEQLKTQYLQKRDQVVKDIEAKNDARLKQIAQKIKRWNPFDDSHPSPFFSPTWMFGIDKGFDVVIGNPPYGAKFSQDEKLFFNKTFKLQDYQLDSYLLFVEKAFDIARKSGCISFIIPNPWLTNLKQKKLREFVMNKNTVLEISHYQKSVFEAIVDTEVVILKKESAPINHKAIVRQVISENHSRTNLTGQENWKGLNGEPINIFLDQPAAIFIKKIKNKREPLQTYLDLFAGIQPYEQGKGNPPQTKQMMDDKIYNSTTKINASYHPILRGKDIDKYTIKWSGNSWIKYGSNLASPRKESIFNASPKIVIRQTGDSLIGTIDTLKFLCLKNMHVGILKNQSLSIYYLLGLFNSKLLNYYFQSLNPEVGEALAEVKKENVEKLPIHYCINEKQQPIISRVEKILSSKVKNQDTTALEREIDVLVYKLYELSYDEVKMIDSHFELSEEEYKKQ